MRNMRKILLIVIGVVAFLIMIIILLIRGEQKLNQPADFSLNFIVSFLVNLSVSSFVAFLAFYEGQQSVKEAERGDSENATALIEAFESDAKIIFLKSARRTIEKLQKDGKEKIVKSIEELGSIPMESQQVQRTIKGEYVKRAGEFRVVFIKAKDKIIIKDIFKR